MELFYARQEVLTRPGGSDGTGPIDSDYGLDQLARKFDQRFYDPRLSESIAQTRREALDTLLADLEATGQFDENGGRGFKAYEIPEVSTIASLAYMLTDKRASSRWDTLKWAKDYAEPLQILMTQNPDNLAQGYTDLGLVQIDPSSYRLQLGRNEEDEVILNVYADYKKPGIELGEPGAGTHLFHVLHTDRSSAAPLTPSDLQYIVEPVTDFSKYVFSEINRGSMDSYRQLGAIYEGRFDEMPKLEGFAVGFLVGRYLKDSLKPFHDDAWNFLMQYQFPISCFLPKGMASGTPFELAVDEEAMDAVIEQANKTLIDTKLPLSTQAAIRLTGLKQDEVSRMLHDKFINDAKPDRYHGAITNTFMSRYREMASKYVNVMFGTEATTPDDIISDAEIKEIAQLNHLYRWPR